MGKKQKNSGYRNKQNKYADLNVPEAEFDFHERGILTKSEICNLAKNFLQEASVQGLTRVLIITGKGIHSRENGPVVKPLLQEFLPTLNIVKQVMPARRDRGGDGALEVLLNN